MRLLSFALAMLLACAAWLAYAEIIFRGDTPEAVQRAIWLDRAAPNARYFERLAELDSGHADHWLREALRLNPRLSSAWIELGAESDLLEAARVDHRYLPAWTLANFYFRAGSQEAFWPWARRAAGLAYDDPRPLLQLANAFDSDALRVVEKLGGSDALLRADLDYLVGDGRMDAGSRSPACCLRAGLRPTGLGRRR